MVKEEKLFQFESSKSILDCSDIPSGYYIDNTHLTLKKFEREGERESLS